MPKYKFLPHRAPGRRHGVWGKLLAWWLLPAHLVWSTLVAAIYLYLNGKSFPYASYETIDQSDMVTVMSTLLLVTRLLITSWTPLCAWRCALILLEKTGVQLLDINHILSTNLLLPFGKNRFSREHFLCGFILLLTWPAQLSNPLASGSISWFQSIETKDTPQDLLVPAGGWDSDTWVSFLNDSVQREFVTKTALGRAAMSYDVDKVAQNINAAPIKRMSPSFQLLTNSLIQKISAPAIFLDDAEWVDSSLPEPIEIALNNTGSGFLNATGPESPLLVGQVIGNCAILKNWPDRGEGTTWSGTQYAALLVGTTQEESDECQSRFGGYLGRTFKYLLDRGGFGCFNVLKMTVTAGIRPCETDSGTDHPRLLCQVTSPSVATLFEYSEGDFSANLSSLTRQGISSNVFLPDVFALMPEVMQALVMMRGPINNGDIINEQVFQYPDVYLKSIITSSYQGVWSALQEGVSDGQIDNITYHPFNDGLLKAKVAKWRVLLWWLLNALITLSGGLLFWLQSGCARDPVTDWVTTAFRLDISSVLDKLRQNGSHGSNVEKADEDTCALKLQSLDETGDLKHGRLKLVDIPYQPQVSDYDPGAYFHCQKQPV